MNEKKKNKAVAIVFIVIGLELLFGPGLLYLLKINGVEIYSVTEASQSPVKILMQWGILSIYPIVLVFIVWKWRKKHFLKDMYLLVQDKKQKIYIISLCIILVVMFVVSVGKTGDFVLVVLNLFYYVVVVAMVEEIILRGLCPFLLRDFSKSVTYLLPSILFAALHIFAYNNFQTLSMEYILQFVSSQMLGLIVSGVAFQALKEYTGTLWIPILLHAVLDFSSIIV